MKTCISIVFSVFLFVFLASAVQADILTVPNTAFTGQWESVNYGRTGGYVFKTIVDGYLQAPVYLPNGAIIDGIRMFYYDNGDQGIWVELVRRNPWTTSMVGLFKVETSGSAALEQNIADWTLNAGSRIVNTGSAYWLNLFISGTGSDYRVYSVQIIYHLP